MKFQCIFLFVLVCVCVCAFKKKKSLKKDSLPANPTAKHWQRHTLMVCDPSEKQHSSALAPSPFDEGVWSAVGPDRGQVVGGLDQTVDLAQCLCCGLGLFGFGLGLLAPPSLVWRDIHEGDGQVALVLHGGLVHGVRHLGRRKTPQSQNKAAGDEHTRTQKAPAPPPPPPPPLSHPPPPPPPELNLRAFDYMPSTLPWSDIPAPCSI